MPDGNEAPNAVQVGSEPAAQPTVRHGTPAEIPPDQIRPNPHNPRRFFPDGPLRQLADSIEEVGVLVPITVYEDADAETSHVLLDGERRWRAAKEVNLPSVPAWVVTRPEGVENVLTMFSIHMLREQWSDIATTWALEALIEELGTDNGRMLQEKTGLSSSRIQQMKRVLKQPPEYQEMVATGELTFNFLVELDKHVLSASRRNPAAVQNRSEDELRRMFVERYQNGNITDVVDLRQVGELIRTSREGDAIGQRAQGALDNFLRDESTSIEEAYREGAAASVEIPNIVRDVQGLGSRIEYLLEVELVVDQREMLIQALRSLQDQLGEYITQLENQ
jgi:ParB family chromosome partitioning protein